MTVKNSLIAAARSNHLISKLLPTAVRLKYRIYGVVFGIANFIRYNRKLQSVKYVHLMWNDKFNKPFVDFLNKNFIPDEHFIICRNFESHPVPVGTNVALVKTYRGFNLRRRNVKMIYTHSLGEWQLLDYFYHHQSLLKKSCWLVWGGSDNFFNRKDKYVMKVCPYFAMYSTGADAKIIKEVYGPKGLIVDPGGYQFPIRKEMMDALKKKRCMIKDKPIVVQVNHSVDGSTIDAFEMLSRFKDENIVVRTILSYAPPGSQGVYREKILECGRRIFGDKFQPVMTFMAARQYAESLERNDILIMNQPRQQGMGNVVASLYLGKKLYIRGDVATFDMLKAEGAAIFDTRAIPSLSWRQFVEQRPKDIEANVQCSTQRVDDGIMAQKYGKAFGWTHATNF